MLGTAAGDFGAKLPDVTSAELLALAAWLAWAGEHTADPARFVDKFLSIAMTGLVTTTSPVS